MEQMEEKRVKKPSVVNNIINIWMLYIFLEKEPNLLVKSFIASIPMNFLKNPSNRKKNAHIRLSYNLLHICSQGTTIYVIYPSPASYFFATNAYQPPSLYYLKAQTQSSFIC